MKEILTYLSYLHSTRNLSLSLVVRKREVAVPHTVVVIDAAQTQSVMSRAGEAKVKVSPAPEV